MLAVTRVGHKDSNRSRLANPKAGLGLESLIGYREGVINCKEL